MTDRIAFTGKMTAEGRRLKGSVQVTGSRVWRNGEWLQVDFAALENADASSVVARWNHDPEKILARLSNDTLNVRLNDGRIEYETAELPNTTYANDVLELVNGKYVTGSSFEVEDLQFSFSRDPDGSRVRTISHIGRIADVSPVIDPAFTDSMAAAFSKETEEVTTPVAAEEPKAPEAPAAPAPEARANFKESLGTSEQFELAARALTNDQIVQFMDGIMAESSGDLQGEMLARYEAFAKVHGERTAVSAEEKDRASRMKALHDLRLGRVPKAPEQGGVLASDDYAAAFSHYLRTGDNRGMEQFAQSIAGTGVEGGFAVPDGFLNRVVERMKAFGGIAGVAETFTTDTGESLRWPSNDDTANSAAIATEGSAVGSGGADLVLGSVTLGAYTYDATGTGNNPLLVSKELLQDSAFDFESFVARKLGERIGRKMAADWANGTGSSAAPIGLLTKTPDAMTATTMYAALVEQMFQVDQAYREDNARWVLGDTTLAKVYNSVDDNGRPLFQSAGSATGASGIAGTLLGFPVTLDQASANNVAFGNILRGYIIRYVRGVQIDVDPYTNIKSRQLAFHAWARADGNIQDSSAYSVSDYSSVTADAIVSG